MIGRSTAHRLRRSCVAVVGAGLLLFGGGGCAGRSPRVERVVTQAGIALLPVSTIESTPGPWAMRLEGADRRLPVWLHANRELEFHAVAGRCGGGTSEVEYDEEEDVFVCDCNGASYRPDGRPAEAREAGPQPLVTYPVEYRSGTVLVDLRPARPLRAGGASCRPR